MESRLVGKGADLNITWELWLYQPTGDDADGPALMLRCSPGGGGGGSVSLEPMPPLAFANRTYGVVDASTVYLIGAVGWQFVDVFVEFGDGSRKTAELVAADGVPVKFYVVLLRRRPTSVVGRWQLGDLSGGEWLTDPARRMAFPGE